MQVTRIVMFCVCFGLPYSTMFVVSSSPSWENVKEVIQSH